VIEKLRGLRLTKAAEIVETAVHETLSYYTFPEEHWRRIRTTDEIDKEFFVNQATCGSAAGSFFRSAAPQAFFRPGCLSQPPRAGAVKLAAFAATEGLALTGPSTRWCGPGSALRRRLELPSAALMIMGRGRPRGEAWRVGCHWTA
jgi:hypothetical protein